MAIKAVDLVGAEPSIAVVNKHGKSLSDIEDRVDMLASTALKERESAPLSSKIHTPSMIQSVKKLSAIAGGSSTLPADVSTFVHSLPVQPLQSSYLPTLMSSSSALNMITGAVAAKESLKSYRDLKNIGADSLAKEALVSSAGAVAQSAAGAAIAASRPLSIISSIDNIASKPSSSSLIGRVNFFTGTVASGLFGIVALCFSYLSFSKIRSLFQLSASLKKECHAIDPKDIGSAEKVAKFFTEKKLKTSPNYVLEKLYSDCHGDRNT
jgi:hypothetical protein